MKKILLLALWLVALFCTPSPMLAQRYLTQVFDSVNITQNVPYGANYTVITLQQTGHTRRQPLIADIYTPKNDNATNRPLVLYFHTGNFLPQGPNGSPSGSLRDSTAIEICTRLAKMGYVVASVDYRTGWDPLNSDELVRRATLINAAYRGVQDARCAIRFFKANAATYGVDSSKVVAWGQGTGGYITLAAATLDRYSKILTTKDNPHKFRSPSAASGTPMVIEAINGDMEATTFTTVPQGYPGIPAGDTLCIPNGNTSASSRFQLCVNMGGALGDISWLDSLNYKIPMVSFHSPFDQFAPYESDILLVGTGSGAQPVVRVQGSKLIAKVQTANGTNTIFDQIKPANDPFNTFAVARADTGRNVHKGLYPILGDTITDSSPWDFWAANNNRNAQGLATNPRMSPAKAKRYIDTIIGYYAPRGCVVLNLSCKSLVSGTETLLPASTYLMVAPNPASNFVRFESDSEMLMRNIDIFDINGRMMTTFRNINQSNYQMERGSLPNGIYFAKVKFDKGVLTRKIVME